MLTLTNLSVFINLMLIKLSNLFNLNKRVVSYTYLVNLSGVVISGAELHKLNEVDVKNIPATVNLTVDENKLSNCQRIDLIESRARGIVNEYYNNLSSPAEKREHGLTWFFITRKFSFMKVRANYQVIVD